jgi:hypothetical protein
MSWLNEFAIARMSTGMMPREFWIAESSRVPATHSLDSPAGARPQSGEVDPQLLSSGRLPQWSGSAGRPSIWPSADGSPPKRGACAWSSG